MAITPDTAREILRSCRVPGHRPDYHALDSSTVGALSDAMPGTGYRAPANRNGSAVRYFYAYLCRLDARKNSRSV